MIWDGISAAVKALSDNIVAIIKEFHLEPGEALKLEMAAKQQMLDFNKAMLELQLSDVANARKREMETGDPTVRRLAYLYTGGYFLSLVSMWHWGIPQDATEMFATLIGVLTAAQAAIIGYYFGSSHGSQQKDRVFDRIVNHKE